MRKAYVLNDDGSFSPTPNKRVDESREKKKKRKAAKVSKRRNRRG